MDPNVSEEEPTTECIKRAVEQCNKIETSLEGCLKVLQESCVPNLPDVLDGRQTPDELSPDRKLSFTVCDGKKSPNLIEVDESNDSPELFNMKYMLKCADVKLQNVLASQQRIIQQLGDVREILIEKDKHTAEAYKHLKLPRDKL